MLEYVKMNDEPIEIQYKECEDTGEFEPCFYFHNGFYWVDDFIRCHNNPWVSDNFPEHIHGIYAHEYWVQTAMFIELIGDEAVNVYRYEEVE